MKKNVMYSEWVLLLTLALPFVTLLFLYNQLPESVPFHFGADGQPDRFGPKLGLVGIFGGMTVFLYLLFRLIPAIDPKQNLNTSAYYKIRLVISVFWGVLMSFMWYAITTESAGESLLSYILAGAGLMLAGIGNVMYSIRPNYFVGIRTPWTLESETVWRRTHQKAAPVFVAVGLLAAVLALLLPLPVKVWAFMGSIMLVVFWSLWYSYYIYRQEKAQSLS
ncbi:SdpI family protein [Nibrella saemangeumensis]|uniref:SdpI family protein n=1 Tax=Nibrella saemangeumensis TaxID=1084526 RepID=A0ABP8MRJ2_9BACT